MQEKNVQMVTEQMLADQNQIVQATFINWILEKNLIESTYNLDDLINNLFISIRDNKEFIKEVEKVKDEILNLL